MPVATTPIEIPFSGGVDEKTREEKVPSGSFSTLDNLRMLKRGSYQKRFGTAIVGRDAIAGGTIPVGKRLIGNHTDLVQTDGTNLYSRSDTLDAWKRVAGYAPQMNLIDYPVAPLQSVPTSYDVCKAGDNYYVVAYMMPTLGGIHYIVFAEVIDASTMTVVHGPVRVSGILTSENPFSRPYLVLAPMGDTVAVFYSRGTNSNNSIFASTISVATASSIAAGWSAPSVIISDAIALTDVMKPFDACSFGSSLCAIAYVNSKDPAIDNHTLTVKTFDASLAQQGTANYTVQATGGGAEPPLIVSIDGSDTGLLWVAYPYDNKSHIQVIAIDPTTMTTVAQNGIFIMAGNGPLRISVTWTSVATAFLMVSQDDTNDRRNLYFVKLELQGSTVVPDDNVFLAWDWIPEARPFLADNGKLYCSLHSNGFLGASDSVVVDIDETINDGQDITYAGPVTWKTGYLRPAGNPLPRLSFSVVAAGVGPRFAAATDSMPFRMMPICVKQSSSAGVLSLVPVDFDETNIAQPALIGRGVALSGSPVSYYDGARSFEAGFIQRPWIISAEAALSDGNLTGVYKYVAVYEQMDAKGQIHQSNISNPFSSEDVTDQTILVSLTPCLMTNRQTLDMLSEALVVDNLSVSPDEIRPAIYRANPGDNVYHRIAPGGTSGDSASFPAGVDGRITFADNTPDSTALLGALLYSQPGIPGTSQVKVSPPSFTCMTAHVDRVVGANRNNVWFSAPIVYGEAPWFADLFQFPIENGGDITALASMDGALVAFKRQSIFFIDGQGPADNGAGGDFSAPQQIASDVGCIDPRSVVVMQDGVMFQSHRGIELLTRARQLANYFGQSVEDSLASHPVITSAVLNDTQGIVVFTCLASEGASSGITITWDYVQQVWSTGVRGDGTVAGAPIKSAIILGQSDAGHPRMTWLQADGKILQEDPSTYLDNGLWVQITLVTPWIHGGILGLQETIRALLIAEAKSGHDITLQIGYDYATSFAETKTWTAAQIAALATSREILEIAFTQPECTAFRVKMFDSSPSSGSVGTGQGPVLIGMQIDAADQGILIPLAEENRK